MKKNLNSIGTKKKVNFANFCSKFENDFKRKSEKFNGSIEENLTRGLRTTNKIPTR